MFVHLLLGYNNKNIYKSSVFLYNVKNTLPFTVTFIYIVLEWDPPLIKKWVGICLRFVCLFEMEVGEVQSPLNQKLSSKSLRSVDFVSRFVLSIKSKFKFHTFNSYYESQCKINGSQKLWTHFFIQRVLNLPPPFEILLSSDFMSCSFLPFRTKILFHLRLFLRSIHPPPSYLIVLQCHSPSIQRN
jgi:hypothetical protein